MVPPDSTTVARVLNDPLSRAVYSTDNSVYQVTPERIALPTDASEISTLLGENFASAQPLAIGARGGGTGTNGQSLTTGLMIDVKRHMNRLVAVDAEARTAVVEPGIVTADLNQRLSQHRLFWPPHTSTLNRATVGGMISTDAAGKGSLIHGRAHRHVLSLEVILADGTPWVAEPVTVAEAQRRAAGTGAGAALWGRLLGLGIDEDTRFALPELARGFSGYGIDRFRRDGIIDPTALLCGAEGTLAIIVAATLRLSAVEAATPHLVVATYPTFDAALTEAVRIRATKPSAIEAFDETTLDRGRSSLVWPVVQPIVGDHDGAVLLIEYRTDNPVGAYLSDIRAGHGCVEASVVDDETAQAAIWKVRADAVGLLAKMAVGGPERTARPTAFVEDCAVPVEHMPAFIAEFRSVLDRAGVTYAMFGHADVGCVHVRPALDLTASKDRDLLTSITEEVSALVNRYGGLLWGEHGRGFRGAAIDQVLDASTLALMRNIKTAFDPTDLLNPAKLYRPTGVADPLPQVGDPPMRGDFDRSVPVALRRDFGPAFACNGNGLCHHYSSTEVMCPSYAATGDPALSPKGRADLIRAWFHGHGGDRDFEQALADNLDQCLSCGACTGRCPVQVDIPDLKSRFLSEYRCGPLGSRPPLRHRLMSRFEQAAWSLAAVPGGSAVGRMTRMALGRALGLVDVPTPGPRRRWHRRFRGGARTAISSVDIVILPDVFTGALEADTLAKTIEVLEGLGLSVAVAGFIESAKFDYVKGNRRRFRRIAERQKRLVRQVLWSGATPVVIEPAVALMHGHEYPQIVDDYPADSVRSLPELLVEHVEHLSSTGDGRPLTLLGHCTQRASAPHHLGAWAGILGASGYDVEVAEVGCCGMAGVFGHEPANQAMSRRLWDLSWAEPSAAELVVATGFSCRSQSDRFAQARLRHPIHLVSPTRNRRVQ